MLHDLHSDLVLHLDTYKLIVYHVNPTDEHPIEEVRRFKNIIRTQHSIIFSLQKHIHPQSHYQSAKWYDFCSHLRRYRPPVVSNCDIKQKIFSINSYIGGLLKYRVSENSSTKKKIKYLGHFVTKSNNFFLNEREIFKGLFDTKSFCIYCSKVSPFTSIQNLSLFTIPSKTFSNVSF